MDWLSETRNAYDTLAASYADETRDLLDRLLHVRAGVVLFADLVRAIDGGPVADVGCGPGHTTALLQELGTDAFGIDLSPAMIDVARREHPGARFEVGSMTDLELPDDSLAGVLAWWSLIHIPDEAVPGVLAQFHRVLRPGGVLAVGFHVGDASKANTGECGSQPTQAYGHRRQPARVADWLRDMGFTVEAQHLLHPDGPKPGRSCSLAAPQYRPATSVGASPRPALVQARDTRRALGAPLGARRWSASTLDHQAKPGWASSTIADLGAVAGIRSVCSAGGRARESRHRRHALSPERATRIRPPSGDDLHSGGLLT